MSVYLGRQNCRHFSWSFFTFVDSETEVSRQCIVLFQWHKYLGFYCSFCYFQSIIFWAHRHSQCIAFDQQCVSLTCQRFQQYLHIIPRLCEIPQKASSAPVFHIRLMSRLVHTTESSEGRTSFDSGHFQQRIKSKDAPKDYWIQVSSAYLPDTGQPKTPIYCPSKPIHDKSLTHRT